MHIASTETRAEDTMARNVRIRTFDQDGKNEEIVELEFTDNDWEILEDFHTYATELQQESSIVKEGIPTELHVSWNANEGLRVEARLPPNEKIYAILELLRPFLLNNERTNFNRVCNIISRSADNRRVRQHLDTLHFLYSGEHLQSLVVAGTDSPKLPEPKVINSEDMFQIWLNGFRFHRDKEKRRIFEEAHSIAPPESSIAFFMLMITDKVIAVLALQRIVALLAGERETVHVPIVLEEPIHYHVFLHASVERFDLFSLDEEPTQLPKEGSPFATRVFDLTHMGPAMFHQFLDPVGQLWMHGQMVQAVGERSYYFRVAPGFRTEDGKLYGHGADIIATVKVVAFLVEDPLSEARRKPAQTVLDRMRAAREGRTSTRVMLKCVETQEELDRILSREPNPVVEWVVVPRLAFMQAYWPISSNAYERLRKIVAEGRTPTFEEVEGTDLFQAWEIFEDEPDRTELR